MRPFRLAPLAILAVLALSAPAAADAARSCTKRGATTVFSTKTTVVVKKRLGAGEVRYFACLRSADRMVRVFRVPRGSSEGQWSARRWRAAGRHLAFVATEISATGEGGRSVVVFDLRTGERLYRDEHTVAGDDTPAVDSDVTALVLARTGWTAWISRNAVTEEVVVHARDGAGHHDLASGTTIDPRRLRLVGTTVTWYEAAGSHELAG